MPQGASLCCLVPVGKRKKPHSDDGVADLMAELCIFPLIRYAGKGNALRPAGLVGAGQSRRADVGKPY